jgi:hypothetical protein
MARQGQIPIQDGYEVAKIYREAKQRLLEELHIQVQVNAQLSRELIELRLELGRVKSELSVHQNPAPDLNYDECPF